MRLIDADALMKDITDSLNQMTGIGIAVDGEWLWAKLSDALENAPTIEERKKGKWVRNKDGVYCSSCYLGWDFLTGVPGDLEVRYSYCPNCGADMRGGDDGD